MLIIWPHKENLDTFVGKKTKVHVYNFELDVYK